MFGARLAQIKVYEMVWQEYQPIDGKPEYKRPVQEWLEVQWVLFFFPLFFFERFFERAELRLIFEPDVIDRGSAEDA